MNMVDGMPMVDRVEQVCDGCTLGKQHRAPFPQVSNYRAERGLELIHADLCGQVTPQTFGGCSYFLLVVDDYSRYMWVEMLKTKDQALTHLKKIKERAEVDRGVRLKAVRTDRGGEFNSTIFTVFCNQAGIKHPQQNGVVERRNQTVVEMARCMLKSMKVPPEFWGEAVATAVYVLNRSPTKSLKNKTPFEAWHGKKPRVDHLRTFGCTAHVKVIGPGISKLSDRSKKMVFLGYEPGTKGYRLYDPDRRRLVISRDVVFEEDRAWEWEDPEDSTAETETFTVENFQSTAAGPTTAETEEEGTPGSMAVAIMYHSHSLIYLGAPHQLVVTIHLQLDHQLGYSGTHHQTVLVRVQKKVQRDTEICQTCMTTLKWSMTLSTVDCVFWQLMNQQA